MTRMIVFAISLAVFAVGGYWLRGANLGLNFDGTTTHFQNAASPKPPKLCKPSDSSCETDVTVATTWGCPDYCWAAVLDDVIVVKGGTKITWNVKHDKFKFAADGIAFDSSSGITCSSNGAKKFECTTSADAAKLGSFKYTVSLVSQDGSAGPPPLDPYVVNN